AWMTIVAKDQPPRYITATATPFFDGQQKLLGAVAVMHDFTQQRRLEKELQETQSILQMAMNQSQAGIAIASAPDGKLLYVNTAGLLIPGKTKEEVVQEVDIDKYVESWNILHFDGTPFQKEEVPLTRAILYGETCSKEFIIRRKDLDDRVVLANAAPILDAEGKVKFAIVVFLDITESKRLEKEKSQMQSQLLHTSKLVSIGTLAAGVAHEINNPLTIIKGFATSLIKLWERKNRLGDEIISLKRIDRAVDRISTIVNRLRTFARVDEETFKVINLHTVIQETLLLIEAIYKNAGITIEMILQSSDPMIMGNIGKIQQVILNILSNAKDAILETKSSGVIKINIKDEGGQVALSIHDSAGGISPALIARIFDPFYTTKAPGKGTGLGLSITITLVESMGGKISAIGGEGEGATFIVTFPHVRVAQAVSSFEEATETTTLHLQGSALAVDDEGDILDILENYLKDFGLEVETARNGLEALNKLKDETYDYVLTDITMPCMDGITLIQEAKKLSHLTNTKFIIITGVLPTGPNGDPAFVADGNVQKPFSKESLAKAFPTLSPKKISSPDELQPCT
ncbi:MAG: ATP-binding protein, partial [Pseudomonadota bacterium]